MTKDDPQLVAAWSAHQALRFLHALLPGVNGPIEVHSGECWQRVCDATAPLNMPMLRLEVDPGIGDLAPFDAVRRVHSILLAALRARGYWWAGMVPLVNVAQPRKA